MKQTPPGFAPRCICFSTLQAHVGIDEAQGKQGIYPTAFIHPLGAIEQDTYGMIEAVLYSRNHLTAGTAG